MAVTVIKNARIVDVGSGDVVAGGIAIRKDRIVKVGDVDDLARGAAKIINARGKLAIPGLIDGHIHVESSMLTLTEFSKVALAHGTTTIVTDPHEIANVLGVRGIKMVVREAGRLPLNVRFTVPSCVPSTPNLETSGATIGTQEVKDLLKISSVVGLGEVMDFKGVIERRPDVMGKINAALKAAKIVDGHAPGLRGEKLRAYFDAGIMSDHEVCSGEEALERLLLNVYVMIREGSLTRNLHEIASMRRRLDAARCILVSDDLCAADAVKRGHMDHVVRRAIEEGLDPVQAVQMATINPASYFRIDHEVGSIEPRKRADLLLIKRLKDVDVDLVLAGGRMIAAHGQLKAPIKGFRYPKYALRTVRLRRKMRNSDFALKIEGERREALCRVIEVTDQSVVTEENREWLAIENGYVLLDPEREISRVAVVERHKRTGNVGLGLVRGFGLKRGALASSISHDSHNIVVVGMTTAEMTAAVNHVRSIGGGICVAKEGGIRSLSLPVAGLLSLKGARHVAKEIEGLRSATKELGVKLAHPFMTMSFLALAVIPELRVTDRGIVDVKAGKVVSPIIRVA